MRTWLAIGALILSLYSGDPQPKGGSVVAYDQDGNPMVWVSDGTTMQCVSTDSERQMVYGTGECSPQ